MPPRYDEAPELIPQNFPEVHHPPAVPEVATTYGQPTPATLNIKPEESTNSSLGYTGFAPVENPPPSTYTYDYQTGYGPTIPSEHGKAPQRILGCSALVFILSIIIALLSTAVIGLAAGTGVEASRANDAEARLAALGASPATVTVTAPAPTSTNPSTIDRGCSTNSGGVTGTTYESQYFNNPTFKIYCNSDAPNDPLISLFVGNFDDCIDACASYSFYVPSDFVSNSTLRNATCSAVSFIPAWTNRTFALDGDAPGNCYLKPGPQNQTALNNPNIGGSAVHAAILDTKS
ncbi:uncharacterized protein F4812DRAFT_417107 [Daldinia caldariorum]|uniref:uncharacterized protein n=1 Tax=Daldinia caldariorum TaxID=326644 RepID=UPI00200805E6|nr:uncharacterized protein F4812DRAFT_417107 [Daldinia caldariorum]KAI1470334.1 hypothetical protein F4812DRAFT_417107 [Daldinia caldariorum]